MLIQDFDYNLSHEAIAIHPPAERGTSKLLVVDRSKKKLADSLYARLPDFLHEGDVVVLNNTKVLPARLLATKNNGSKRELILVEKHGQSDDWFTHKVVFRGRLKAGDELKSKSGNSLRVKEVLGDGIALIDSQRSLLDIAYEEGEVPLPPYLNRQADESDIERYQTVWASVTGSVAAPTASLNMTEETISALKNQGVKVCYLTLHVGLGTFLPIRTDEVENHVMHKEYFEIPRETVDTIREARAQGNKVTAIGTTVTRTLEYAASRIDKGTDHEINGEADIFIYPGYEFKMVDHMLTNFHAPRSTVLMMVAAFGGWELIKQGYKHAIDSDYKFLSYGDSMFII